MNGRRSFRDVASVSFEQRVERYKVVKVGRVDRKSRQGCTVDFLGGVGSEQVKSSGGVTRSKDRIEVSRRKKVKRSSKAFQESSIQ